jgi:predicted dehydrogenase
MRHVNRRDFVRTGLAASAAFAWGAPLLGADSPNEAIRLGFISCGGRARDLMGTFSKLPGVVIAGLSDPDQSQVGRARQAYPTAKTYADFRGMLDDSGIDAVVVATCNHWHCLAAIWAMEAGKDVYVEKPLSHSQWEGRQTVAAAKKYGKICQVGTQQRSDPMQAEIKRFLHEERALGKIVSGRVNRYGVRASIGKLAAPLSIPSEVDYNLWLGPAQDEPIYRNNLQYDWHWVWNTGSGEMGNWGVHVLDDLRNNVFQDKVTLPQRILGGGGRVVWDDAGETPNVHFVLFDTGEIPVVIGLSNITAAPDSKGSPKVPGPGSGYIAYCEGGRLEGQRGRAQAFDRDGKLIKEFKGNSGNGLHQQNFLDAVRRRDPSILKSDVKVGHDSTGWCNLANIAFRTGGAYSAAAAAQLQDASGQWQGLLSEMQQLLTAHGIPMNSSQIRLSPLLEIDVAAEKFVGENADAANRFLKREYREPFVVPELIA